MLVGHVGVGRQALIGEVDVHRPGGQRLAAYRERCPSDDDMVPPRTPGPAPAVVVVHDYVFARAASPPVIPLLRPGQHVVGHPHASAIFTRPVRGVCYQDARMLRLSSVDCACLCPPAWVKHPGTRSDDQLDQQRRDRRERQHPASSCFNAFASVGTSSAVKGGSPAGLGMSGPHPHRRETTRPLRRREQVRARVGVAARARHVHVSRRNPSRRPSSTHSSQ